MKVYYIIPLNYQFTEHPKNFKINYIVFMKDLVFDITQS